MSAYLSGTSARNGNGSLERAGLLQSALMNRLIRAAVECVEWFKQVEIFAWFQNRM